MEELARKIFDLKTEKEKLENEVEVYKARISDLDTQIEITEKDLLNAMKVANNKELDLGNIVATYFSKENVSYTSDSEVLKYLKDNNYTTLVTTKTTESLNKNALKKELKINETLSKALENLTVKTITEWVVVTTKENHQKMLEHIEEGKKGK